MKRIVVIGCPGSGKTTFAKKLRNRSRLPLFHLDAIWHKPDRTHIAREEFDARLDKLLALDAWIIDGNYSRTMERRMDACDTVFFLDYPTEVCLEGIRTRRGTARSDMPWIETEEDVEFIEFVKNFNELQRPQILALLDKYKKNVIVFTDRAQADAYLSELQL